MTIQSQPKKIIASEKRSKFKRLWFEKLMAAIVLLNFVLVLFDLSYVPWRDFYLVQAPQFTQWYGQQFKGISEERFTVHYLDKVQALEDQVAVSGVQSPQVAALLDELQTVSAQMVNEDPFQGAGKSGTLERIKHRMRERLDRDSAKEAFAVFWSQDYLTEAGWTESIEFFNQEISPLIATNYHRQIGFDGNPLDRFWRIDLWFTGLFALEFLARTIYLSRRYQGTSWLDAVVWRWYDLLLLLPFWRWLRIIPTTVRLNQSNLVDLDPINNRIIRSLVAGVAVEITEIVVVRIIDQVQDLIRQGEATRWLLSPDGGRRYIDINGINEIEAISGHLTQVLVYQVLPKIRPEVEAVLQHVVSTALGSSATFSRLQNLPGMKDWSQQLTQRLVSDVSENSYHAMTQVLEDETGSKLMKQLMTRFGELFRSEIQQDDTLEEIESLSIALLDEIKINYIKRVEAEDVDVLQERKKELYGVTQGVSRGLLTD
ncbi:hypothetical protein [Thermocoleostomius sinensis]|uniref:Uncharacterized protein n=1 Tax=Thermocoleostomius sinensis A174 TaxID=2016057 RepID=A0A9E9C873_9CYAN|nr:hypothetical protein [Thermocoleostomius sinensis]WAL60018.1 hypothetical protein OXH18_23070 [Thermocoleostomius sinensis A174]